MKQQNLTKTYHKFCEDAELQGEDASEATGKRSN